VPDVISRLDPQGKLIPPYKLSESFIANYIDREPLWGPLGPITFYRTYSRQKPDGTQEAWWECCRRVVEGTFYLIKLHYLQAGLPWKAYEWFFQAEQMYDSMFYFRFLPPGRGLWAHGTEALFVKGAGVLANCGFVSTKDLDVRLSSPFVDAMGFSMFGTGIGIDTEGAGKKRLRVPTVAAKVLQVEDSREGWMEAYTRILEPFGGNGDLPIHVDGSLLRPAGAPLKTFGGRSGGPAPLLWLIQEAIHILLPADTERAIISELGEPVKQKYGIDEVQPRHLYIGIGASDNTQRRFISGNQIRDLFAAQGACVAAGGMRRSAILMKGSAGDQSFMDFKNFDALPPEQQCDDHPINRYRWAANNSVDLPDCCTREDLNAVVERCSRGEDLGFIYMDRHRAYGRTCEAPNNDDHLAIGVNACAEITLEDLGLCLVDEVVMSRNFSLAQFLSSVESAYLYAKAITLTRFSNPVSDEVNQRTRRIGVSVTGVMQALHKWTRPVIEHWLKQGYSTLELLDGYYSERWHVPQSIKLSTVKPSGTVSLLPGVTPGGHAAMAEFWVKRMRISQTSPLIQPLKDAGYHVEVAVREPATVVVSFPVKELDFSKARKEQTVTEQFEVLDMLQRLWADNSVSFTVDYDPATEQEEVVDCLMRYKLKGCTIFPRQPDLKGYVQLPFSELTEAEYLEMSRGLKPIDFGGAKHEQDDVGCTGDRCVYKAELAEAIGS